MTMGNVDATFKTDANAAMADVMSKWSKVWDDMKNGATPLPPTQLADLEAQMLRVWFNAKTNATELMNATNRALLDAIMLPIIKTTYPNVNAVS